MSKIAFFRALLHLVRYTEFKYFNFVQIYRLAL